MTADNHRMSKSVLRRARKAHWCDNCGRHAIQPGQQYRERTVFPGHDVLTVDRPARLRECFGCAQRYGRGDLLTQEGQR